MSSSTKQAIGGLAAEIPSPARELPSVAPGPANLVEAMERISSARAPLYTFHVGAERRVLDGRTLVRKSRRVAAAMRALGVARGDRVVMMLPNGPDFLMVFAGALMMGAVPVPLATPLTFGNMTRHLEYLAPVLEDASPALLVASARVLEALRATSRFAASVPCACEPSQLDRAPRPTRPFEVRSTDPAFIQYTSGTTGKPRGAVISHGAVVANAEAIARALELRDDDVGVSWLPFFHDMGLVGALLTALCRPYSLHLSTPERFVMQPRGWLETIAAVGATLSVAPNFAYELCARRATLAEQTRLGAWRLALTGAEPVRAETLDRFDERFRAREFRAEAFCPVYGLAEATLAVTTTRPGAGATRMTLETRGGSPRVLVSAGKPVPGVQVRVRACAQGEGENEGEIEVSSPALMSGYFRNERASAEALSSDGWLRTGDLGVVSGDELYVLGRRKELIIQSGRNLHPVDVETAALEVEGLGPGIAAFGIADPKRGTEALWVAVECAKLGDEERRRSSDALRAAVLSTLGACVDGVVFAPAGALPRTTSGKIRRAACRALVDGGAP